MTLIAQDLMRGAPDITNVVEACNLEGRQERLENMLSQLEMCEKALQDYLEVCTGALGGSAGAVRFVFAVFGASRWRLRFCEPSCIDRSTCLRTHTHKRSFLLQTKRIAFPRFYFVAPADLLDILSKGSNPQLILRHLPKVHMLSGHYMCAIYDSHGFSCGFHFALPLT
jgi:dynein heavy chain, axonemal